MIWRERVAMAEESGHFTADDWELAQCWTTCAIGEQWQIAPQIRDMKWDCEASLGMSFWNAVDTDQPKLASRILDQIEDEALRLKREMLI